MWIGVEHILPYEHESKKVTLFLPKLLIIKTHPVRLMFDIPTTISTTANKTARGIAFAGLLAILGLFGCATPVKLGSNAQKPYQWESLSHHPQFAWHRHRADSAALFVRIPANEPLHLRKDGKSAFRYAIEIELLVNPIDWPEAESRDPPPSVLHRFKWEGRSDPDVDFLTARFSFPLAIGRYRIIHTVRDLHRGSDVTGQALMDGWSAEAPVRCLAFNSETGDPAWGMGLPSDSRMGLLVPADRASSFWSHSHLHPIDSFPSAPFLDRSIQEMRFPKSTFSQLPLTPLASDKVIFPEGDWTGWKCILWDGEAGLHRWEARENDRPIIVAARQAHFPEMRDLDEMIRATRYIAKRQEYQSMRRARDPKRALDEFWLALGNSPEESRQLIAAYYGRVHEANVHFSGLKEGWCTDRGMVHIIFGHADRIRRDRMGETWVYGDEGDVNALVFRFSRKEGRDDINAFKLERHPGFRSPWEAMVGSWRRGKVRKR